MPIDKNKFSNEAIRAAQQQRAVEGVKKKKTRLSFVKQQIGGDQPTGIQTIADKRAPVGSGLLTNPKPKIETKKTTTLGLSFDKEPIKIISEIGTAIINMKKSVVNQPLYDSNIATVENNAKIKQEFLRMHKEARLKALGRQAAFERGNVKVQTAAKGISVSEGSYGAIEADIIEQSNRVRRSIELGFVQQRMGIVSKAEQEKNKQLYMKQLEFAKGRMKLTRDLIKVFTSRIHYDEIETRSLTDESKEKLREYADLASFNKMVLDRRSLLRDGSKPQPPASDEPDDYDEEFEIGDYGEDFTFGEDEGEGVYNQPGENYKDIEDNYSGVGPDDPKDIKIEKAAELTRKKLDKRLTFDDLVKEELFDSYTVPPDYIAKPQAPSKSPLEAAKHLTTQIFEKAPTFNRSNYVEDKGKGPPKKMKRPILMESGNDKYYVDEDTYDKNYDTVVEAWRVSFKKGMSIDEYVELSLKGLKKRHKNYKFLKKARIKEWVEDDMKTNPEFYSYPEEVIR